MAARVSLIALWMLLTVPMAGAEPAVQQPAVERVENGIFIRGGSTVIDVGGPCPGGCPRDQTCRQQCDDQPCTTDAPAGAECSTCTWRCMP